MSEIAADNGVANGATTIAHEENDEASASSVAPRSTDKDKSTKTQPKSKHSDAPRSSKNAKSNSKPETAQCCRARCLPVVTNIRLFAAVLSLVVLLRAAIAQYTLHVSVHVQKRYHLREQEINFVFGVEKIAFAALFLFAGYYGNQMRKPFAVLCGAVLCACGAVVMACTYFLSGALQTTSTKPVSEYLWEGVCHVGRNRTEATQCARLPTQLVVPGTFNLLCLGQFLLGIGGAFIATLGLVYVEEATEKKREAALLLGIVVSCYGLGNFIGSLLAYGFTSLHEKLTGDPPVSQPWHDIRAWWLGLLVLGICLLLVVPPLALFPRWIREPDWLRRERLRRERRQARNAERERERRRRERHKRRRRRKRDAKKRQQNSQPSGSQVSDAADGSDVALERERSEENHNADANSVGDSMGSCCNGVVNEAYDATDTGTDMSEVDDAEKQQRQTSESSANEEPQDAGEDKTTTTSTVDDTPKTIEEEPTPQQKADAKKQKRKKLGRKVQDLPLTLLTLLKQPLFSVTVLGAIFWAYHLAGHGVILPRYLHFQLRQSVEEAASTSGACIGLATCIGVVISAVVVYKFQLSDARLLIMVLASTAFCLVSLLVLFPLGCADDYAVIRNTTSKEVPAVCTDRCVCTQTQLQPICDEHGTRFPSACHAGCLEVSIDPTRNTPIYSSCFCTGSASSASAQICPSCSMLVPYVVIVFLAFTAQSMGALPLLLVIFRNVPEKRKSVAVTFAIWIVYLAAVVPGYTVYRSMEDACCLLWRDDCHTDSVCWQHNNTKHRYMHHGITAALQAAALVCFAGTYYLIRRSPGGVSNTSSVAVASSGDQHENNRSDFTGVDTTASNI